MMHKTKLGVTVGLFGAILYFTGLFGGVTATVLLAGYVLLAEQNEWLRKNAVKAVALVLFFEFLYAIIHFIPEAVSAIDNVAVIFKGHFNAAGLVKIATAAVSLLSLAEKLLFIVLGIKAFNQGTVKVPVVDRVINQHMA